MNTKSKIYLALALVLSVTACSRGGGSHHGVGGETGKQPGYKERPVLPSDYPSQSKQNTAVSLKGFSNGGLSNYVYSALTNSSDVPNNPASLSKYYYLHIPGEGDNYVPIQVSNFTVGGDYDMSFMAQNKKAVIGSSNKRIYLATDLNNLRPYVGSVNKATFSGLARHSENGKLSILKVVMDATFGGTGENGEMFAQMKGSLQKNGKDWAPFEGYTPIMNGMSTMKFTGDAPEGLRKGDLTGYFSDPEAGAFTGTYNSKDGKTYGAFLLDNQHTYPSSPNPSN
ncbi:Outer membrane protein NilC [Xenorhabdus nematophila str. Anatoliense]|nr:Outer membrane protein NilC [Xenorhabdus nematophila str. Anatoliense]CEE95105.1 Outer membrane protein NilC [Xenorhabdus nematophila str. Anatoliense]